MDAAYGSRFSGTLRSFNGCWTCRLRRKKCDETRPVCGICASLHITCHFSQDKPEWMDGGVQQESMAEQFKREVKENAHRYRGDRGAQTYGCSVLNAESTMGEWTIPQEFPKNQAAPTRDPFEADGDLTENEVEMCPELSTERPQRAPDRTLASNDTHKIEFGRSDIILLMFYLEHLLPFLYPFYRTSLLQGGKAWVLEMMISSPVLRQATMCQSSYFFSLARGTDNLHVAWETVLLRTKDAFAMLRKSLQVIEGSTITEHLHGAVRIMASIMQIQRFEIAILSFTNCQSHLNAAVALFRLLLDSARSPGTSSSFKNIMKSLDKSSPNSPAHCIQFPSAEQAAFRFSTGLLMLDDIIASTLLQQQPRLLEYQCNLLDDLDSNGPSINLEATVGCQNWVMLAISKIAILDSWKQRCKQTGNLDVMELVHRATIIKESLEAHLTQLETSPSNTFEQKGSLLDILTGDCSQTSGMPPSQTHLVTRVWAHAAFIYLFVIVSGWQPANLDVRFHVSRVLDLLAHQISPPTLLRTMVWPFCVAGCLAESMQETRFRGMVETLQPPRVFGTVRKALEIMENVWKCRDAPDAASRDLATCFRSTGELVLLV